MFNRSSWLDSDYNNYLDQVRTAITNLYNDPNEIPLAYYTPHGPSHCQAVEDLLYQLIPEEYSTHLNMDERFYLLASAWLHDIGMLRSVAERYMGKEPKPSDTDIRKNHHINSEKFIMDNYVKCGLNFKIKGIDHSDDKRILSGICRFHRKKENINEALENFNVRNEQFKFRLLAAYLRLADSLHVDSSRAPDYAYAICLAYDIPSEEKMHWIKSRLVQGVSIDTDKHEIIIQFRIPKQEQMIESKVEPKWVKDKINSIIENVMDDIKDELSSVMYTLTNNSKFPYYLHINKIEQEGYIEEQTFTDLLSIIANYNILTSPSASTMVEMIMISIANIAGYYLDKNSNPFYFGTRLDTKNVTNEINKFLSKQLDEVLKRRSCHFGMRSLIHTCQHLSEMNLPDNPKVFIDGIDAIFKEHSSRRIAVKENAKEYFRNEYLVSNTKTCTKSNIMHNILLYGYSDLVIRSLCGFRDSLITDSELNIYSNPQDEALEKHLSKKFRIFICEGHPKSQIAPPDRYIYHDGFSYALELRKRNFKNIIIIPDIVVTNVFEKHAIDFIIVGANGFSESNFKHSAGHRSILEIARKSNIHYSDPPKILLAVSMDKYLSSDDLKHDNFSATDEMIDIDGYRFWKPSHVNTRDSVWFLRYSELEEHKDSICFYNPREDVIPFEYLDNIISDVGCFPMYSSDHVQFEKNRKAFIDASSTTTQR